MSISVKSLTVSIGEARSNKFNIEVGGCKFTMSGFSLSQRLLDHSYLTFSLVRDPMESISDTQFQACADLIGKPVELNVQTHDMEQEMAGFSGGKAADIDFKGFVNSISASRDNSQYTIHIGAVSYDATLDDSPDCRSWLDKPLKDIIEDTLKNSPELDYQAEPMYTEKDYTYCVKWNETSYRFLQRMAVRHGEWLFHDGKTLFFGKLPEKEAVQLSYPSKDMSSYNVHLHTMHLNFRHIASNEVIDDTCTHNNLDEMDGSLNALNDAAFHASTSNYPQPTMENIVSSGFTWEDNGLEGFVKTMDTPQAKGTRASLLTYDGSTSCPKLCVGAKLTVMDNFINDEQTNGKSDVQQDEILITAINHYFDNDDLYSNTFTGISAKAEYPPYANANAVPRAMSCRAWVKYNDDPEKMGRIRVYFPWGQQGPNNEAEEMLTPWIRVEQTYAGGDRGAYIIPEVNDEVMIDFEDGNAEMPYVRASHFNCLSHMDYDWTTESTVKANEVKAIRTRNGHTVEVHDLAEGGYIRIYDYQKENYILTYSTDEKLIKLESTGNIELYAKNDIIMKAGHNIESTAGKDIKEEAGRNKSEKAGRSIIEDAGTDIHYSAGNDYQMTAQNNAKSMAGNDMEQRADNEYKAHSGNDMTINSGNDLLVYSEQNMFVESNKDYELTVGNNGSISIDKDFTMDVGNNADVKATNSLEYKARDIVGNAQNEFSEYSVSHTIKAQNAIKINATATIDIKALMIKEN